MSKNKDEDPSAPPPILSVEQAHAILSAPESWFEIEERLIRGTLVRVWKNAPATLRDAFLAGLAFGDREFLVYQDERVSYSDFGRATCAFANELIKEGVCKGDRVAIALRNLPEWPVAFFAATLVGAIAVPLNILWANPEFDYALKDCGAKVLVLDGDRLGTLADQLHAFANLTRIFVTRQVGIPGPSIARHLETVIGQVSAWRLLPNMQTPNTELDPEDDATIVYTSGTTGKPRGVLSTHRNVTSNMHTMLVGFARAALLRGEPLPDMDPRHRKSQDVRLSVVPFFHVSGCIVLLIPAVIRGSKIIMMKGWSAETAMKLIERERVTALGGVPILSQQILEHPARSQYDLSSLAVITYGGAASSAAHVRNVTKEFKNITLGNSWGMTECSGTFAGIVGPEYQWFPNCCGVCPPVGEMKIMSIDGANQLPFGRMGELWVKGPQVAKGYWNDSRATAEFFHNGWVRTGDLASIDKDGYCFIVDRTKDMLIRGGENIYCIEVENALFEHVAVADAAVVGIASDTFGEEPAAVVILKPGAEVTEPQLRAFVAKRLAAYKVPSIILFSAEPLPRNAGGKVLKVELRKLFDTATTRP